MFGVMQNMPDEIYTVSAVNKMARYILEESFPSLWIEGEISNYHYHGSGHRYFTLKDDDCQIRCAMWKSYGERLKFEPKDGYTNEMKPVNTGFGISYVLPVVVAILKARKGDIVVIENPESHLHPKGQSVLGRMVALAAQDGVQFIVETHSDHVINGVRVAVKNGNLSPSKVKIFYFDRVLEKREQYSEVEEIRLDKNGELSNYPKGFLDEWSEQLMQLI